MLGVTAKRDTFAEDIIVQNEAGKTILAADHVGVLSNHALVFIRDAVLSRFNFDPGNQHLYDAIKSIAEARRYNPVAEWLNGLEWDGQERLKRWLPEITHADQTALNNAAGFFLILAMVARARYPGTKFDLCFVFEGVQGSGKSSLLARLASGPGKTYFTDVPGLIGMPTKDRAELISGKWVVELAELSGLAKSETENVKAFLSQTSDRFRPPYERVPIDRLRRSIFIATTNAPAYLTDPTGNRRFVPIRCGAIDLRAFEAIRGELFAEANHVLNNLIITARQGGIAVEDERPLPLELAQRLTLPRKFWAEVAELTETRRVTDPREEALPVVIANIAPQAKALPDGRSFLTAASILSGLRDHIKGSVSNSGLATMMYRIGWNSHMDGPSCARVRGYVKLPTP